QHLGLAAYWRALVCKVVMYAMESYRPRRSSLARGRPRRAPGQRRGMAASVVLPVGVRALRAVILDPVPLGGQLEIVPVHSSGTHPRHGSLAALGRATGVSETERLRFQEFAFERLASGRCRAKVVLSWADGRQFTGESDGVISQVGAALGTTLSAACGGARGAGPAALTPATPDSTALSLSPSVRSADSIGALAARAEQDSAADQQVLDSLHRRHPPADSLERRPPA